MGVKSWRSFIWHVFVLIFINCKVQGQSNGDLRLVGGSSSNEGRLEVYYWSWGTVCDDFFSLTDATVACRQLGYSSALNYYSSAYFGQGSGSIWLDDVGCAGSELSLSDCSHAGWGTHNCGHHEDVGVQCEGSDYSLRLMGGSNIYEGRVEILYLGVWGTVCDDSFGLDDAHVVCRELGYGYATDYSSSYFGSGSGTIWLDNVACSGSESTLSLCPHGGWGIHNCNHGEDVGVVCSLSGSVITTAIPTAEAEGSLRLVGGSSTSEGRVEVYYSGMWGTVCDDSWGRSDAQVVCRQLGFPGLETYYDSAHFGQGFGAIWLDGVSCSGSESRLDSCSHNGWGIHNCGHSEDASVVCQRSSAIPTAEGSLRLAGGSSTSEGRVEVYYSGAWGTVCDDSWDNTEAQVVCRQLGFPGLEGYYARAHFGEGEGAIWLDGVSCLGSESRLDSCVHNGWGDHNCAHSEDASVTCQRSSGDNQGDVRLAGSSSSQEGRVEIYLNGQWGAVCNVGWDSAATEVVCRSLGYKNGGSLTDVQDYGISSGSLLAAVVCSGYESFLYYCSSNTAMGTCTQDDYVAIECYDNDSLNAGGYIGICIGPSIALFFIVRGCIKWKGKQKPPSRPAPLPHNPPRFNHPATVHGGDGGNDNPVFNVSGGVGYSPNANEDLPCSPPPAYDSINKYSSYGAPQPPAGPPPPPPPSMRPAGAYPPASSQGGGGYAPPPPPGAGNPYPPPQLAEPPPAPVYPAPVQPYPSQGAPSQLPSLHQPPPPPGQPAPYNPYGTSPHSTMAPINT